jgi:hypothetical protein
MAVGVAATASACELPPDPVTIENHTERTLTLAELLNGTEYELTVLGPTDQYHTNEPCIGGDLVVRNEDGSEFARRPGPLCQEDPPWVLTEDD